MNWIQKLNQLPEFVYPTFIFTLLVLFGLSNYKDYGISWDEPAQRLIGEISYNYIVHDDQSLKTFRDADYGVGIELPLMMIEKGLKLENPRQIYLMRHLVAHFFFLVCLLCGYLLILNLFKSRWLALAGVLFFVLHPLIYAHSFFNTKDVPFMATYLICFLFIYKAFDTYKLSMFLLAGMASGFMINLRIMGVMLALFVFGFIVIDLISKWKDENFRIIAFKSVSIFLLTLCITLYVTWPYLYENPIQNLVNAFNNMSKFRWDGSVLYFGELVQASNLPWHYGIVWFLMTTPIIYLIVGLIGMILIVLKLFGSPLFIFKNGIERHVLIYLLCFIAPIVAVIIFKSVLYDGWRHLYFIYPPFVLLAVYALQRISQSRLHWFGASISMMAFVSAGWFMIKNHPNQQVYFNAIINRSEPEYIRQNFEQDYWGVSYIQGIRAVLEMDDSPILEILMANAPGDYNLDLLPKEDRDRIVINYENPKYLITEYRWHPQDYPYRAEQEVFSVVVQNNTILSVFKLRD